jgi:membrane protein
MTDDHNVDSPFDIRPRAWRKICVCVFRRIMADNVGVLAGGVAFYGFLSIFPAIAGALMVWGLFADGDTLVSQIQTLRAVAPQEIFDLISTQMIRISTQSPEHLRIGAIVTLLVALWSASRGAAALMGALNMAYHERETRGFLHVNLLALGFTLAGVLFVLLSLAVIAAVPPILESLFLGAFLDALIRMARWLILIGVFFAASAAVFRFAPSREHARWRWILPGALAASLMWLAASVIFSSFLTNFNAYNATFGSLGAVAALLMWFWLSAYAICMGAELNAQLELFTTRDTTEGAPKSPGHRGAYVADHTSDPDDADPDVARHQST